MCQTFFPVRGSRRPTSCCCWSAGRPKLSELSRARRRRRREYCLRVSETCCCWSYYRLASRTLDRERERAATSLVGRSTSEIRDVPGSIPVVFLQQFSQLEDICRAANPANPDFGSRESLFFPLQSARRVVFFLFMHTHHCRDFLPFLNHTHSIFCPFWWGAGANLLLHHHLSLASFPAQKGTLLLNQSTTQPGGTCDLSGTTRRTSNQKGHL